MQTVQVEVLTTEEQAAKHAAIMAENARRDLARTAAANRKAGHAKPEPGDRLYVTTMRGIKRRGRAGIRFDDQTRTELLVVDNDPEKRGEVPEGTFTVTVDGAEAILLDGGPGGGLNVSTHPSTNFEAAALRSQLADRDSENAALKAELEQLRIAARQATPMDPQGSPAKLRAADRAVRRVADPGDGFGGKD